MFKLMLGKKLSYWPKKDNHFLILESEDKVMSIELPYSKAITPYIGGILSRTHAEFIRNWLNEVLEDKKCQDTK